jgi:hypothetical protein
MNKDKTRMTCPVCKEDNGCWKLPSDCEFKFQCSKCGVKFKWKPKSQTWETNEWKSIDELKHIVVNNGGKEYHLIYTPEEIELNRLLSKVITSKHLNKNLAMVYSHMFSEKSKELRI